VLHHLEPDLHDNCVGDRFAGHDAGCVDIAEGDYVLCSAGDAVTVGTVGCGRDIT